MLFSLFLQTFLLVSAQQPPKQALPAEASTPTQQTETISGVDESTGISFKHTLPAAQQARLGPSRVDDESLGILTTAESVVVMDRKTSKVLFAKERDAVRPVASMTKLMTAYTLISEGVNFDETLTVHPDDYRAGGRVHLYTGEQFQVQDVWMAGLIASDNVAIASLVRHSGFSTEEFAERMNHYADELGLESSEFVEPTGIDRGNVSTAEDMAMLLDEVMRVPKIADTVRRPVYSFQPLNKDTTRTLENTNKLLRTFVNEDPYQIDGGKTGFTHEAGYCLGVVADGPEAADDIIVVALGADTLDRRFLEVKGLIDWTYRHYRW